MNKIEKLLQELCPNGVEYKELGEVGEFERGKTITRKTIVEGNIPVIAGGRTPAYFHNQHNRTGETIIIAGSGAYAGFVSFWNEPIFVSDAFSIKVNNKIMLQKFCYYFLKNMQDKLYKLQSIGGVPHIYTRDIKPIKIPIPPLSIQQEIIKILDASQELTHELTQELRLELTLRKQQYEYYREQLLTFPQDNTEKVFPYLQRLLDKYAVKKVEWKELGEVGEFERGTSFQKSDFTLSGIGCIHYGQIHTHYKIWATETISFLNIGFKKHLKKAQKGDLVIATTSEDDANVAKSLTWLGDDDIVISSDACIFRHTLNPKFVSYFFTTYFFLKQKQKHITGVKVRRISIDQLKKLLIPIPPLEIQQEIVKILDKFEELTSSLSSGLPAEIRLRQQQYEYYREKLLTFKELNE